MLEQNDGLKLHMNANLPISERQSIGILLLGRNACPPAHTYTQGTLNSLAVGILLYMATIQMIAEDFSSEGMNIIAWPYRYGCFVSLFVFCGIMTFIAIFA